jgi:hypothetical protein
LDGVSQGCGMMAMNETGDGIGVHI